MTRPIRFSALLLSGLCLISLFGCSRTANLPQLSSTDDSSATDLSGSPDYTPSASEGADPGSSGSVSEDSNLIETSDFMEAWLFNDANASATAKSILSGGTDAKIKWGFWLPNDTFGTVLDFSTAGSYAKAEGTNVRLDQDFTISVFMMAPPREQNDRVILTVGKEVRLYLSSYDGFALRLDAKGLSGVIDSGVPLDDEKWHHVAVSKQGAQITYYVDGEAIKKCSVKGTISLSSQDVVIGADQNGENGFDGSLAEVSFSKEAKTPDEVTHTVIKASDNTPKDTRLSLKHGVVIDRPQYFFPFGSPQLHRKK